MKNLLTAVILWTVTFMSAINAQSEIFYADTLNILMEDEIKMTIFNSSIRQLKDQTSHVELLQSFLYHLEEVVDEIPDYETYKILYAKDVNLSVEEIVGSKKFQFEDGKVIPANNQNIAELTDGNTTIHIRFSTLLELTTEDYQSMVKSVLENVKGEKKFLGAITYFPTSKKYNYSFTDGKMKKNSDLPEYSFKLTTIPAARIGLFKNKPLAEISLGIGAFLDRRNNFLIYGFYGQAYKYNDELNKPQSASYVGAALTLRNTFTLKVAYPLDRDDIFETNPYRLSMSYYKKNLGSFSIHSYKEDGSDIPIIGVGFGVGL